MVVKTVIVSACFVLLISASVVTNEVNIYGNQPSLEHTVP